MVTTTSPRSQQQQQQPQQQHHRQQQQQQQHQQQHQHQQSLNQHLAEKAQSKITATTSKVIQPVAYFLTLVLFCGDAAATADLLVTLCLFV